MNEIQDIGNGQADHHTHYRYKDKLCGGRSERKCTGQYRGNCKPYMIRLEASLIRLSPSRMVESLLGTLNPFITDVAATASGGEMMPPNRNPNASVNPGIRYTEK